jgi:hypothetical protein
VVADARRRIDLYRDVIIFFSCGSNISPSDLAQGCRYIISGRAVRYSEPQSFLERGLRSQHGRRNKRCRSRRRLESLEKVHIDVVDEAR